MTVPTGRRRESELTFLDLARTLCGDIVKFCDHLPRSFKKTYGDVLIDRSLYAFKTLDVAYNIYICNQATYQEKLALCKSALDAYQDMRIRLDVLFDTYHSKQKYISLMFNNIDNICVRVKGLVKTCDRQYRTRVGDKVGV